MARLYSRPVNEQALQQFPLQQQQLFAEATVNKGMISVIDPADIPEGALTFAKNCRVRFDKTSKRYGYSALAPADSDTAVALKLDTFKTNAGTTFIVKLRPAGPRYTDLTSWFAPAGTALVGASTDRFSSAVVQNLFVFCNNGVDVAQKLDVVGNTFGPLGAAPASQLKAKFVTGFYNRVVLANITGQTPVTIAWSGDTNPTVFDPTVDISAGVTPLVESPGDSADYITGVFGFTNLMVIMRERSIWLATKQPIGSSPFYFYSAVAGIGSNCPYSIAVMPNGLCFLDMNTGSVWAYILGQQPQRIGLPIELQLIAAVTDPTQVFGSYSPLNHEYSVGIQLAGTNVVRIWTYNFRSQAWTFDEVPNVTDIHDSPMLLTGLTVGGLQGTVIALTGTVANLSPLKPTSAVRIIGDSTGHIAFEDITADTDYSGAYETIVQSKDFYFPDIDTYFAELKLDMLFHKGGGASVIIEYSRDSGQSWVTAKTVPITTIEKPILVRYKKQVKSRRFMWRVRANTGGLWDVLGYEVHVYPGGESRK